jgi:queuine tRNA-ribosyltransferase
MEDIFTIKTKVPNARAREGVVLTSHGSFETPMFMPVGTRASVKAVDPLDLQNLGAQIVLSNTYHLMLRPGDELIKSLGGLHKFMGWNGPILTDSGGFQIFSLEALRKIEEFGVIFKSTYDGSEFKFTPERALEVQGNVGSDIMMCLDECLPYPNTKKNALESMERTYRWAERSYKTWDKNGTQILFGISQGGFYMDLREKSAESVGSLGFPGHAAGGLALGEPRELMLEAIEASFNGLPEDKPRYLMGLGTPLDILDGIRLGADMFDCVLPTRNARNGQFFTSIGKLNINNARYKNDPLPPDESCDCYTCQRFTRAYLRHLFQQKEPLFMRLATIHNLHFYLSLVRRARKALREGDFLCYYKEFSDAYSNGEAS